MSWIDTSLQAVLAAKILIRMAVILDREAIVADLKSEIETLDAQINAAMWDEGSVYYYDRFSNGELSRVKHLGAYWALLAGIVPAHRIARFIAHLEDPAEFNRPHRIPVLSADDPHYSATGNYWSGGVWPPTDFMVLKGLDEAGWSTMAHQIAQNHLANVVKVFESSDTGWEKAEHFRQFFGLEDLQFDPAHTLWENYAPESAAPGDNSKPGYVGWTGLPPIAVLLEDVFGLVPDAPSAKLTWNVRLLEEHGVSRYPFGQNGSLDLMCARRASAREKPRIEIRSNVPMILEIYWEGGLEPIKCEILSNS